MSPFILAFIGPAVLLVTTLVGGPALGLGVVLFFGIIPALDLWVPLDTSPSRSAFGVRHLPALFVPAHLATLSFALHTALFSEMLDWQRVVLVLNAGLASSMAINVAHELMHRPGRVEQRLAEVLMASTSYTHFCVEHVQGHHKRIGTPNDPATSRFGESLFAFLPRSMVGGLLSAWQIERARSGISPRNRMIQYGILHIAILAALFAVSPWAPVAFVTQGAVAAVLLETINYIEHYGLVRPETAPGRYGRVLPEHSWNSSHRLTNWMLLNLARHSDHHAFAARGFPDLRHHEGVPQLPASYTAMMLIAAVPPLWFRVMNPRVLALSARAEA